MSDTTDTVGDELRSFAEDYGISFEQYLETWLETKVVPSVPARYKRLLREVALALPSGWDDHAEWSVEVNWENSPQGYANVFRDEEAGDEVTPYTITLYPRLMDALSDSACRWVLAHEFACIASKLRHGSIILGGKPYTRMHGDFSEEAPAKTVHEDAADTIALRWGFDRELQAFLQEDGT